MILREISDTSIAISLLRYFYRRYGKIEQRIIDIYCNSQTHMFTNEFWKKIKTCFKYSFLRRVTETKQTIPVILDNSRAVQYLIDSYKGWKDKIIRCSGTSLATYAAKDVKTELYLSPTKIIGIIVVTAIVVNAALAFILHKQIGLWGWLMRGVFLFAAVVGLFCRADWLAVKENSLFLKKMRMD